MIQATIHQSWEDLRHTLFSAKKSPSAVNGLLVMFLRVYSCCLSIFNKWLGSHCGQHAEIERDRRIAKVGHISVFIKHYNIFPVFSQFDMLVKQVNTQFYMVLLTLKYCSHGSLPGRPLCSELEIHHQFYLTLIFILCKIQLKLNTVHLPPQK